MCHSVYAKSLEEHVQLFIKETEMPRLQNSFPDAEIHIEMDNQAALSYLPDCLPQNLTIENQRPDALRRTTYSLQCSDPVWQSFIPVSQQILIEAIKAGIPISRKQIIDTSNTIIDQVDITQLRGQIYTPQNPPYGLIASRNISANTFITDRITELPVIIKKGQKVLITAQSGQLFVRMTGEAQQDGILGQQIRVKNLSSDRIVYGKVVSDGEVRVDY